MTNPQEYKPFASIGDRFPSEPTIFAQPLGGFKYVVNITDDIDQPRTYDQVIALLSTATEMDEIVFNINSYGGYVDSLNMLLGWKARCPARQIHVLMGNASSAATSLFLSSADEYIVGHGSSFMIHEFQVGHAGTMSNTKKRVDHLAKINEEFVRETYRDFLTEEEINQVLNGVEIYLDASEINDRLQSRYEKRKLEYEAKIGEVFSQTKSLNDFSEEELLDELVALEDDIKKIKDHLKSRKKSSRGAKAS